MVRHTGFASLMNTNRQRAVPPNYKSFVFVSPIGESQNYDYTHYWKFN